MDKKEKKYYIGVHSKQKRVKITTDVDCLSPEITDFIVREMSDNKLIYLIEGFEGIGWAVCLDTESGLYETPSK